MDHRLRVMFPSYVDTKYSWADSQYDVVRRPIARIDNDQWWEPKHVGLIVTYPMLNLVDVSSTERSLAVIVNGLTEYEVVDDRKRTVAITLFRAISNPLMDPDNKDASALPVSTGQCLGEHTFRYAIYPHNGRPDRGDVLKQAYCHNLPLKATQAVAASKGKLPAQKSFISFSSPDIVLTAVKRCQDGNDLLLRFFNPTGRSIKTDIDFGFNVTLVHSADLLEKPLGKAQQIEENCVKNIEAGPKKIITLRITPGKKILT